LTLLIGIIAGATIPLQREAMAMLEKIPVAIDEFQRKEARAPRSEDSLLEKAQAAAKKIEDSAAPDHSTTAIAQPGVTPVRVVDKPMNVQNYVLQSAPAALVLVSHSLSVLLLVFFLLSVGRLYRRKVVRISGPSFARMRK